VTGELARDRYRDVGAAFATPFEIPPALVKPAADRFRLGADEGRMSGAAASEREAGPKRPVLVPGGLDQQPPSVAVAGPW